MVLSDKDLMIRRQKGKSVFLQWKASIEMAIKHPVSANDFIGIEATESFRVKFFDKVHERSGFSENMSHNDFEKITQVIDRTLKKMPSQELVLLHSQDKYIGALRILATRLSHNLQDVWSVVKEDLCVADWGVDNGFCFEKNLYDNQGNYYPEGILEVTRWGVFLCSETED